MPSQAYFVSGESGDWYACIAATAAGESPVTHPEKWSKLEIPDIFEPYLVEKSAALLLTSEGQSDKRMAHEKVAEIYLEELTMRHSDIGDAYESRVFAR